MNNKSQVFKCREIEEYDKKLNKESYEKIRDWIDRFSDIKEGDIVSLSYDHSKNVKVIEVKLCQSRGGFEGDDMSFYYIVAPVNKAGDIISGRKEFVVGSVVKDGVLYHNPTYRRTVFSPAQLRFDDYFYIHRRHPLCH